MNSKKYKHIISYLNGFHTPFVFSPFQWEAAAQGHWVISVPPCAEGTMRMGKCVSLPTKGRGGEGVLINFYSLIKYTGRLLIIAILFTACKNNPKEAAPVETHAHEENAMAVELTEAQFSVAGIELGKIEQKTLSNVLNVNGVLDVPPQNLISISAPWGGYVVSTKLLQGMRVQKGEVLAVMEHPDYVQLQQDYIDKKSTLEYLEQDYKRQEELSRENVNAAKVFQQVKSDYTSMKAQVKGAQEKLAMIGIDASTLTEKNITGKINLYSPINGYVTVINVNVGKYVNPTDVMFEVVNTEHLHAELTVYEKDVAKLKIGQTVHFTLPNENDIDRKASIHLIGRKIDADRSVRVHAHLEKEDAELLPGMYINARIELDENPVNALPEEAVVMSEGKYYVFVMQEIHGEGKEKSYHFAMKEVKKGVTENGFTEINFVENQTTQNLSIVTKGAYTLLSKMKNTEDEEHGH